jgi:anti-sigma B factor antagonist
MTTTGYLIITRCEQGPRTVLRLAGELDLGSVDSLQEVLHDILDSPPHILLIDAARLRFADCGGLAVLAAAHYYLAAQGRELVIANVQPAVRRLVAVTGLDEVFHLDAPGTQHPGPLPQAPG